MIVWKEALRQMRQTTAKGGFPVPFSIQFVQADRRKRIAGKIVKLESVTQSGIRPLTKATQHKQRLHEIVTGKKNPHHYEHSTVNIYNPVTQRNIKIHTRLITKFNEQPVIY